MHPTSNFYTKFFLVLLSISALTLSACASSGDKEEMMKKEEMEMKK